MTQEMRAILEDRISVMYSREKKGGLYHAVDNEVDPSKTLCGKPVFMWEETKLGLGNVDCVVCKRILRKRGGES